MVGIYILNNMCTRAPPPPFPSPPHTDPSAEETEVKSESQVYVDSRSYVVLEVALEKPLIPKRPASVLAERWARKYCMNEALLLYSESVCEKCEKSDTVSVYSQARPFELD